MNYFNIFVGGATIGSGGTNPLHFSKLEETEGINCSCPLCPMRCPPGCPLVVVRKKLYVPSRSSKFIVAA